MLLLAVFAGLLAWIGLAQAVAGVVVVRRFCAVRREFCANRPAVTVLKPLHGDEALLEQALASVFAQDYPDLQIVLGVQDSRDPALAVVARVQARFPDRDIAVVVDTTVHGINRKVGNLINMYREARHDVVVIADSDVCWAPDLLGRLVGTLAEPGTGMVTALYAGLPASGTLTGLLGMSWISHNFLPGALMARVLGRQDCLGATTALRRETLEQIGGLRALADHIADDNVLGRLVQAQGLRVRLADAVVATVVAEARLGDLFRHELRWARTVRALEPMGFAASAVQYPLAWALLAVLLGAGAGWAVATLLLALVGRASAAWAIDGMLARRKSVLATRTPIWLFPLRDLMSLGVFLYSYAGTRVEWRGHRMHAGPAPARNG